MASVNEEVGALPREYAELLGLTGGDLHTHIGLTDGIVSLAGMITAAEARGYECYAVTDHAPNLVMQRMTDEKMLAQRAELRARAGVTGLVLLHGSELSIAADGSVDWNEGFLNG